jgi:hypothetical protein
MEMRRSLAQIGRRPLDARTKGASFTTERGHAALHQAIREFQKENLSNEDRPELAEECGLLSYFAIYRMK